MADVQTIVNTAGSQRLGVSTSATIRLDEALLEEARKLGVNVSEAARQGIQEAVKRARYLEILKEVRSRAVVPDEPSGVTVRRMRDERSDELLRRARGKDEGSRGA